MTSTELEYRQFPLYQVALRVYAAILPLTETERRLINERLFALVERLLEHVGSAAAAEKGPARRQILSYGRMALTKLAIVVDAAERASLISVEQADCARRPMASLEQEIIRCSSEQPSKREPAPSEENEPQPPEASLEVGDVMAEVIAELQELRARDAPAAEEPPGRRKTGAGRGG